MIKDVKIYVHRRSEKKKKEIVFVSGMQILVLLRTICLQSQYTSKHCAGRCIIQLHSHAQRQQTVNIYLITEIITFYNDYDDENHDYNGEYENVNAKYRIMPVNIIYSYFI